MMVRSQPGVESFAEGNSSRMDSRGCKYMSRGRVAENGDQPPSTTSDLYDAANVSMNATCQILQIISWGL